MQSMLVMSGPKAGACLSRRFSRPCGQVDQELDGNFISPESGTFPGQKSEVAAALGRDQSQMWVRPECRVLESFKRDERVVLRLNEERRHADSVEVNLRRLGRVIVVR